MLRTVLFLVGFLLFLGLSIGLATLDGKDDTMKESPIFNMAMSLSFIATIICVFGTVISFFMIAEDQCGDGRGGGYIPTCHGPGPSRY
jgi:hypothetical protein